MKSLILSASIFALLSACSQGRKQYKTPADQRVDQKAGPADLNVPSSPSNPAASLVDGWYVDPTPEEVAEKLSEAIRAPIVAGKGMAGVTTTMSRDEIETKLGQPDFVARDSDGSPIAVYGSNALLIFYDRVTKNKVELILAGGGYTGAIAGMPELKISSDLGPLFASNGGEDGFVKKLYQTFHPDVADCTEEQLCRVIRGQGLALIQLTNTLSILFQDQPAQPNKQIFEIRVEARTPDAGLFAKKDWQLDLLQASLKNDSQSLALGQATWADVRATGDLGSRVEPGDFGRSLSAFGLGLSNSLSFGFERPDYRDGKALTPVDTARVSSIYVGNSFLGGLRLGEESLVLQFCPKDSQSVASKVALLQVTLQALDGSLAPSSVAPVSSDWQVSVVTSSPSAAGTEGCVRSPLQPALKASLSNGLNALVSGIIRKDFAESAEQPAAFALELRGALELDDLYSVADASLAGAPLSLPQALSNYLFEQTHKAAVQSAKRQFASLDESLLEIEPVSGNASLEEKQSLQAGFVRYTDASRQQGFAFGVSYSESSQDLGFTVSAFSPSFRNNNGALSAIEGGQIDLDRALSLGSKKLKISGPSAPGSLLALELFDRSTRYAEVDSLDPVSYIELATVNLTDGLQSRSYIYDFAFGLEGLVLYGTRKALSQEELSARPELNEFNLAKVEINAISANAFPTGTQFLVSCGTTRNSLTVNADFQRVYQQLKSCGLFLTPGYATENIPSELHIAPEGKRTHGLTLTFVDGLLSGFMIYDTKSLSL